MKAFRMKSRVFLTALAIACSGLLVGVVILLCERTGQRTLSGREGDTTLSLPVNQTDENVRREAAASTQPQRANIGHTGLAGVSEEYEGPKPRPEGRPDGVVLDRRDDPMDADGILRRVSLIETDLKYPQVLVADHVALGKDGEEIHISRVAMAAGHFLARPAPGVDPDDLRLAFEGLGFKILRASPVDGLMRISLPEVGIETLVQALSTVAEHNLPVAFAEPDFLVFTQTIPSDPGFQQLWGLHNTGQTGGLPGADISALEAWGVSVGDSSLVVGVIDTGIDYDHPDLVANIWNNPVEIPDGTDTSGNGFVDDIVGWNFYADNSNPMDDHYHGTHVAGTIGAVGDNAIGIAGVAWDVRLMALKFLSRDGIGFASDAVAAIDYATGAGVSLTCNSWGGGGYSHALKDAIDRAADAGILFVAAAGNSGLDADMWPMYPAAYDSANIISVAATDHNDRMAWFSNYGEMSVHIAAPGVGIHSTFPTQLTPALAAAGLPVSYGSISGTSMAAPHVAGAAALLLAADPGLTLSQARNRILQRSTRLDHFVGVINSAGRLNLHNLVNPSWEPSPPNVVLRDIVVDSEDNGKPYFVPGETADVMYSLVNLGETISGTLEINIQVASGGATLIDPTSHIQPPVPGFSTEPGLSSFRLMFDPDLSEDRMVDLELSVAESGGTPRVMAHSVLVFQPKPRVEIDLNFRPGEPVGDPIRERVYLMNQTHRRIFAIDMEAGNVHAMAGLEGSSVVPPPYSSELSTGMLAVAPEADRLYAALTSARKIQVFELPDLIPLATLDVPFMPVSLAATAGGRLFVATTDYWGQIFEIDPADGRVLRFLQTRSQKPITVYKHSLLRTSLDGSRLFFGQDLWWVGGPGRIEEFDVSGEGDPWHVKGHPFQSNGLSDFAVDVDKGRIYTLTAYLHGVQVTEMSSGRFGEIWPLSLYAKALALHPDYPLLYGGGLGSTRAFTRSRGDQVREYGWQSTLPRRGLAATPGGRVLYVLRHSYRMGIIGAYSLDIENPPLPSTPTRILMTEAACLTTDGSARIGPGDTVRVSGRFQNFGGEPAEGLSIELIVDPSHVSEPIPSSHPVGTLAFMAAVKVSFELTLDESLEHAQIVPLTFRLSRDGAPDRDIVYSVAVYITIPLAQKYPGFMASRILADPMRDLVYLTDGDNARIFALDTQNARFFRSVALHDPPVKQNGILIQPGHMAISPDGGRLFVGGGGARCIQVFSLPELTRLEPIQLDFIPHQIAVDPAGRIYVARVGSMNQVALLQLSPQGEELWRSNASIQAFQNIVIRNDGTRLYDRQTHSVETYDIASVPPVHLEGESLPYYSLSRIATLYDPDFERLYLVTGGDLDVADLTGAQPIQSWPSGSCRGAAFAPGSPTLTTASNTRIAHFDRATGAYIRDYDFPPMPPATLLRGLAETPNGRVVYLLGDRLGILGTFDLNLEIPAEHPMQLLDFERFELSGNDDGMVNPGETWRFTPRFKNVGLATLEGLSFSLAAEGPGATVLTAPFALAFLTGYGEFVPEGGFAVAINNGLSDLQRIPMRFRVDVADGVSQTFDFDIVVSAGWNTWFETWFEIGHLVAAPGRNIVFVTDVTNRRIFGLDTATGVLTSAARLAGAASLYGTNQKPVVSSDGSRLYVPLAGGIIQVFDSQPLRQTNLLRGNSLPSHPALAATADGRLFAAGGRIQRLDPETGRFLEWVSEASYGFLHLSPNDDFLYGGVTGTTLNRIDEFAVIPAQPAQLTDTFRGGGGMYRLAVDEAHRRLYAAGRSFALPAVGSIIASTTGMTVINMETGRVLPDFPTYIEGAQSGLLRFDRTTGAQIDRYALPTKKSSNSGTTLQGLDVTVNEHIAYWVREIDWNSGNRYWYLGLIGAHDIGISLAPVPTTPLVDLGADRNVRISRSLTLAATVAADAPSSQLDYQWSVVSGPDSVTFTDARADGATLGFSTPGAYRISLTVLDGDLEASDIIGVSVIPDPPQVYVEPANPSPPRTGDFRFIVSRMPPAGVPLNVNLDIAGDAMPGDDYLPLPAFVKIPAGGTAVDLPVHLTAAAGAAGPRSITLVLLPHPDDYDLGPGSQATIRIPAWRYLDWAAYHLPGADPETRAPGFVDADGVANLLRYAQGLGPSPDPVIPLHIGRYVADQETVLGIRFPRRVSAPDLTYEILAATEAATSISDWISIREPWEIIDVFPSMPGVDWVTVRTPASSAADSRGFYRLRVNLLDSPEGEP